MPSKRVLLILKGFLGDAVMVTPLLHGLTAGGYEVHVLTSASVITLLEDTFPQIKFHAQRKLSKPTELLKQAKELNRLQFDLAIVVNRSFRSALLARMSGIPLTIGHATDHRGWLLARSMPHDEYKYEPTSYLELAHQAGIEIKETDPELKPNPDLLCGVKDRLQGASIGIQPGARHPWKRIPETILAEAVRELQKKAKVVLLGGKEEREFGDSLKKQLSEQPIDLIGEFNLKESIAACSQLKLMIGGDTGLMHIAAATGCPTITLFGPTFHSKWGHHYEPHQVLIAKSHEMSEFKTEDILNAARHILCS